MDKSYLPWTITMMVLGAVFITFFFGFMKTKLSKKEESDEKISKTA